MERAGWSSGVFSAVKLNQSDSISGPCATSKPMEPKIASMRSKVSDTGCRPPWPRWRPGRVTSSASALSCACSSSLASAWRRSLKAASIACLVRLMAAPRDFFSSTPSAAMPFISSVMRPDLPRNRALAFSRSAGVAACAKPALALSTNASNSFINPLVNEKGPVPFQAPALVSVGVNSSSQLGLDLLHDVGKSGLVMHRDVSQHFAVDFDRGLLQAVGELAVGQAAFTRSGVDTGDPELTEHPLAGTAIPVGILPGLHHRFFGDAEDIAAAAAETLGKGQNFFVAGSGRDTTFDARHVCTPCSSCELNASAWQHLCHVTHVGLMHCCCTPQMAFVLGGLLGQDMTLEGLAALDGATGTNTETLFRAALGLHFGHVNAPSSLCSRGVCEPTQTCWPRATCCGECQVATATCR